MAGLLAWRTYAVFQLAKWLAGTQKIFSDIKEFLPFANLLTNHTIKSELLS